MDQATAECLEADETVFINSSTYGVGAGDVVETYNNGHVRVFVTTVTRTYSTEFCAGVTLYLTPADLSK